MTEPTPPTEQPTNNTAAEVADLRAQLEAAQAEIARVQGVASDNAEQAKKYRQAKAETARAAEAAQRENGEYKQLAEQLTAERDDLRAKLEAAAPVVAAFEQDQKARAAALEAKIAGLSEADRALIAGAGSLATQEALAARFLEGAPTTQVTQDTEGPTSTATKTGADLATLTPDEWRSRFGAGANGTVTTSLGAMFKR